MILLYHSIVPNSSPDKRTCLGQALKLESFIGHVQWLRTYGTIYPVTTYLEMGPSERKQKRAFALTFDDGLATTHELAFGWLRREGIPATHFITTSHLEQGKPLWFNYLNALCFEEAYEKVTVSGQTYSLTTLSDCKRARESLGALAHASGQPVTFCDALGNSYPLKPNILREYGGMTYKQVAELTQGGLFEVGAHTITHVYLSQATPPVQTTEIGESKLELERLTGRTVPYFAYPVGDYTLETLDIVKRIGFQAGFATTPKKIGSDHRLEIERVGIYSASLLRLKMKVFGIARLARRLGIPLG